MEKRARVRLSGRICDGIAGAIFVFSGLLKVADPLRFQLDMVSFPFLPVWLAFLVALFLPWLEVFAGTALILGRLREGGRWILVGLTLGFILFILLAWATGQDAACGCFGDYWVFPNWGSHLLFNLGLLALLRPFPGKG